MGNVHRSGNFCDFNFSLVGSEEISKVFLKREDACKGRRSFFWNFKFRSREGAGQAAAGPAAAFAEPEYQVGMHAAAALVNGGELGGAETADSYFLNSLHGESAAIFHGDLGRAFAATEGIFSFNASHGAHAAIFHGDLGRASAATEGEFFFNALHDASNSVGFVADAATAGAFRMHDFEGHGQAASVLGDTGSAFSCTDFLIRDLFASSLIPPIHACAHSRLVLFGVGFRVVCGCCMSLFVVSVLWFWC